MRALMVLAVLAGCNGDKDGTVDPTDSGTTTAPISFDLTNRTVARTFDANVDPLAIQAHQVSSMLLAGTALVAADDKVQDRLNTDGGGSYRRTAPLRCWARPDYPMFSFTLDYTECDAWGLGGGVFVNDHPSGPLLYEFTNLAIERSSGLREMGGILALDTRDAFPEPLYWQLYETDSTEPSPDNRIPINVLVDRERFGIQYTGGGAVDFGEGTWAQWGVATITNVDYEQVTVVHGARTPEEVSPDEPTGTDVLKLPLNWLECRCPTSGIQALDMPLNFTSVTLDIDDLEVEPDDVDDPEVIVPVEVDVFGQGVLTHTGCGTYDVEYTTDAAEIPIPTQQLVGSLSFLCSTAVIEERRCAALVAAAANLEGDLVVEITADQARQVALDAVSTDFDTDWCAVY